MTGVRWIVDNPVSEKFPLWTRANVGEVLPDPPSPLGWDLSWDDGGTLAGWRDCAVNRLGIEDHEISVDRPEVVGTYGGYAYLGATFTRVWAERTPGMSAAAVDAAYYGDHPDVPPYVAEPWHHNPHTTEVMGRWLGWVMGSMEQTELEADRQLSIEVRAGRPDLRTLDDAELLERAVSLRPLCRRMFDQHINQSAAASIGPGTVAAIAAALGRPEAALSLIAGLGGVDSAAPSFAMWDMSRNVRASTSLTAAFAGGTPGLTDRLRALSAGGDADAAAFVAGLEAFLVEFGSRGPNEWDVHSPVWETDPDLVLAMIDRMRLSDDDASPRAHHHVLERTRCQLADELDAMLAADPEAQAQFRAGLASAAVFVPGRERSKTSIIRVVHEMRMAVWEVGRRAVERGELDAARDVCLLFIDEVEQLVRGDLTDVGDLVAARQAHLDHLVSLEPPFIINGSPPPVSTWPMRRAHAVEPARPGDRLVGMPGCPGVYRGIARVVLDAADPGALEPGEILVAPHTDPAWTPLFVPAGAVVVDVGAALSHAIIVSRELGIPCVVSVTDATRRIADGTEIEVDGAAGTVTVV
jgi:pyruvate,water dikinase